MCFLLWELSVTFYIFHRHRVYLVDHVDLICSLYSWWEGLGTCSIGSLPLGFNCGFISTSPCGRPLRFVPEAVLEDLGLPLWGSCVEVVQLLGSQGFWKHQVLRGVDSQGSRKYSALEGYGNQYWPICSSFLAWRTPLTEKPGRPQSTGSQRVGHDWSDPVGIDVRLFGLWQLCPSESWMWRWCSCLACGDPGSTKCEGTWTASTARVMAPSESFV